MFLSIFCFYYIIKTIVYFNFFVQLLGNYSFLDLSDNLKEKTMASGPRMFRIQTLVGTG